MKVLTSEYRFLLLLVILVGLISQITIVIVDVLTTTDHHLDADRTEPELSQCVQ